MKYCVLLRGVNVNGVKMKMADLRAAVVELGFHDAITILATGNIVLTSDKSVDDINQIMVMSLSKTFSYDAFVFIYTREQIRNILNMIDEQPQQDDYQNYFLFCDDKKAANELMQIYDCIQPIKQEKVIQYASGLYWQVPKGYTLTSGFGKIALSSKYKQKLTIRNINTIKKLAVKLDSI